MKQINQKGISLPEVIMAIAIFALVATGIIILITNSYDLSLFTSEREQAQRLAKEGVEATESIANRSWNELTTGEHGLDDTSDYWQFSGESEVIDDYTRVVNVESVYRNDAGEIVTAELGDQDLYTKKVIVTINWDDKNLSLEKYLTTWSALDWEEDSDNDFKDGNFSNTVVGNDIEGDVELQAYMQDDIKNAVGFWNFDYGRGEIVYDRSGHDNDGVITGASWNNGDLDFDGADNVVEVSDADNLEPRQALTVEAWVNLDVIADGSLVQKLSNSPGNYDRGYIMGVDAASNAIYWRVGDGSDYADLYSDSITTGAWYQVVGIYDNQKARLFINGNLTAEEDFAGPIDYTAVSNLFIGSEIDGQMDDVIIYNKALTSSEIKDHYNNGILETRLAWHLDETEGEVIADDSGYGNEGVLNNESSGLIMEVGETSTNDIWITVNLANEYTNPVVIAQMFEQNSLTSPASVRVRNVTTTSFEVKLDYPDDADYVGHPKRSYRARRDVIYYMVIEEGAYTLPDGTKIEAHSFSTSKVGSSSGGWGILNQEEQTYSHIYSATPVVLHQIQTENNAGTWVTTWASEYGTYSNPPTTDSLQISLNGSEALTSVSSAETIGWVAIKSSVSQTVTDTDSGDINYETQLTGDVILGHDDGCYTNSYNQSYTAEPIVFASQFAMDGTNGGWGMVCSNSTTEVGLHNEEDKTNDTERSHTTEEFGFVAFGGSFAFSSTPAENHVSGRFGNALDFSGSEYIELAAVNEGMKIEVGQTSVSDSWATVTLENEYINPVVIAQMFEQNSITSPASVRVKDVVGSSFKLKLDYPDDVDYAADPSRDYWAETDTVYYMVIEEGAYTLPDGTKIEAHTFNTSILSSSNNGWTNQAEQTYSHAYSAAPVVLHQIQTENNADTWVTTWASEFGNDNSPPSDTSLQIALNGAEVIDSVSTAETIGWVAVENDATQTITNTNNGDIDYETQNTGRIARGHDNGCYATSYNQSYTSAPIVLGSQITMLGNDGGWSMLCANSTTASSFHSEEDKASDSERGHSPEYMNFLAFSGSFALDTTTYDELALTDELTLRAWIYREADSGAEENIILKGTDLYSNADYGLFINSNDNLEFFASDNGTWPNKRSVISTEDIELNQWYFATGVYDGSNLKLYINGVETGTEQSFLSGINDSVSSLYLNSTDYPFDGMIDEVKIYNHGLDAEQVWAQFKKDTELIGQWHLESTDILDSSSFSNDGAISGATLTSAGKFGSAISFDGEDDYISVADDYTLNMLEKAGSISLWFKADGECASDQYLISKDGDPGFGVYLNSELNFYLTDTDGEVYNISSDDDLCDGSWHYFVGIWSEDGMKMFVDNEIQTANNDYSGSWHGNSSDLYIGALASADNFAGTIDEVALWSKILSGDEIAEYYNNSLVGWWRAAENAGTTLYDGSPHGNDGSISGASWAIGKFNAALDFADGDYVNIADNDSFNFTDEITLAAWVRPDSLDSAKDVINNGSDYRSLQVDDDGVIFNLNIGGSDTSLTANAIAASSGWHFVAGTYDGSYMRVYIDGHQMASLEIEGEIAAPTGDSYLGGDYVGSIDEARIYSRALTNYEIFDSYVYGVHAAYVSEGNYESGSFDSGLPASFNTLSWQTAQSASHAVSGQFRTAVSEGALNTATWYGLTGAESYFNGDSEFVLSVDHNGDRWAQYKTWLSSDGSSTPRLNLHAINYSQ